MNGNLEALYNKLGKAYFELKADAADAELAAVVDEIKGVYDQQKKINTRLKFLRGIVECTECGTENGVASSFCCNCGATLPHKKVQMDGSHCAKCGNVLNPGQRFCGVCGTMVENPIPEAPAMEAPVMEAPAMEAPAMEAPVMEAPAMEAPVMEQPVVAPVMTAPVEQVPFEMPSKRFCANCGAEIVEADAVFCAECGTRV